MNLNTAKTAQNNLSTNEEKTLYNLIRRLKDEKLILTKIEEMLCDETKFKLFKADPTLVRENSLNNFL